MSPMISRLTFFCSAFFWVIMNVLLWRAEYGLHGGEISVPVDLVWRKILTAPDSSSLTVFQDGQRSGFCEFSTGVGQAMAQLDENSPPPEGVAARAGYRIQLSGNVAVGVFTNRVRFDGQLQFSSARVWRELSLKISSHVANVEIHSLATNQNVHLKITSDGATMTRDLSFTDLQNPNALLRAFAGDSGSDFFSGFDLPGIPQNSAALVQTIHWEAHRERVTIGHEPTSVYRLETQLLQNKVIIYVSMLGEILRVELPGGIIAALDGWNNPL
jgi:hypothetical protein